MRLYYRLLYPTALSSNYRHIPGGSVIVHGPWPNSCNVSLYKSEYSNKHSGLLSRFLTNERAWVEFREGET